MWYKYGLKIKTIFHKLINKVEKENDIRVTFALFLNKQRINIVFLVEKAFDSLLVTTPTIGLSTAEFIKVMPLVNCIVVYITLNRRDNFINSQELITLSGLLLHEIGHYMQKIKNKDRLSKDLIKKRGIFTRPFLIEEIRSMFEDIVDFQAENTFPRLNLPYEKLKPEIQSTMKRIYHDIDNLSGILIATIRSERNADEFIYNFNPNLWTLIYEGAYKYQVNLTNSVDMLLQYISQNILKFSKGLAYKNKYGSKKYLKIIEDIISGKNNEELESQLTAQEIANAQHLLEREIETTRKYLHQNLKSFASKRKPKKIFSMEDFLENQFTQELMQMIAELGIDSVVSFDLSHIFGKENNDRFIHYLNLLNQYKMSNSDSSIYPLISMCYAIYYFNAIIPDFARILQSLLSILKQQNNPENQELEKILLEMQKSALNLIELLKEAIQSPEVMRQRMPENLKYILHPLVESEQEEGQQEKPQHGWQQVTRQQQVPGRPQGENVLGRDEIFRTEEVVRKFFKKISYNIMIIQVNIHRLFESKYSKELKIEKPKYIGMS